MTFSTHRVSPLYVGAESLDQDRLATLSKRLRDLLVGDVVRGVEVGLDGEDGIMSRAGPLEEVDLRWSALGSILGIDDQMLDSVNEATGRPVSRDLGSDIGAAIDPSWDEGARYRRLRAVTGRQTLHISLQYESALCTGLLLPTLDEYGDSELEDELVRDIGFGGIDELGHGNAPKNSSPPNPSHFRILPLLLLRMPTPLKSAVIDFFSTTFDCRISPLRLGTRTLLTNLERWITVSKQSSASAAAKDVVLALGFSLPTPAAPDRETDGPRTADLGLKSIDVIISARELHKFCDVGTRIKRSETDGTLKRKFAWEEDTAKRRRVEGHFLEEGWEWRSKEAYQTMTAGGRGPSYPFTEALGIYFDEHLALNLFDPRTKITKIACGGFVMSEARLKLFSPVETDSTDGGTGRVAQADHLCAVVDCLGDLLDRAMARP